MSSFYERQKSLFNHLKNAEDQCGFSKTNQARSDQGSGTIDARLYRQRKRELKQFKGKESIFKKPQENLRDCLRSRRVPEYMKHPEKWVYYSLSDVTPEQMSDSTNAATAQTFLREMEEKESTKGDDQIEDDFVFKKPTFYISSSYKKVATTSINQEVKMENNKVIMPEYVVGVSTKKEKKNKILREPQSSPDKTKKVELKLQHLFDDEEE